MKIKLFVALFATVFGVSVFAAPKITEENAKSYAAELAKETNLERKVTLESHIVLGRIENVETFQQIVDVVYAAKKKYNARQEAADDLICQYACWWFDGKFAKEGYEFSKKIKNNYTVTFILYRENQIPELTEQEKFNIIKTCLIENKTPKARILKSIKYLQEKNILLGNDEEMKDVLKKLNRIYTINLGSNKDFWNPIVATVRLALSTY